MTARGLKPPLDGILGRNFNNVRCCFQVISARGTKLVGFGDFALAVRARGMQVAFAVGAEVEACAHAVSALGTGIGQRLAHQEVNHETDEAPRRQENNHQNGPQSSAHSAARGIAVDVGNQENHDRETKTC